MSRVRVINTFAEYQSELLGAGVSLVVADFTASWCGPCQRIAPVFDLFSNKYPLAIFLKIDVDKCQEAAASQGVSAMPTFVLFKNKVKVDRIQGADTNALEAKIKQYYDPTEGGGSEVAGHMDLGTLILSGQCSSLNETDETKIENILKDDSTYIESSCDEQLILSFTFSQPIKLHSIKIKAPADQGPKGIKLFVNLPGNLDFSAAESLKPLQEIEVSSSHLDGKPVNLRFVKFQNVSTLDLFIMGNQEGGDVTRIDYIGFIGSPIATTNMNDFKRVVGKEGESHE